MTMTRRGIFWSALAALLLVAQSAQAQMTIVGSYSNGTDAIDVFIFAKGDGKSAGIGFKRTASVNFGKADWGTILALWRKAKASQAATFRPVGSYTETATKGPSTLTLSAGTGVRFTIDQPAYPGSTNKAGTFSYTLPPSEFARFDADMAKVSAFFGN